MPGPEFCGLFIVEALPLAPPESRLPLSGRMGPLFGARPFEGMPGLSLPPRMEPSCWPSPGPFAGPFLLMTPCSLGLLLP